MKNLFFQLYNKKAKRGTKNVDAVNRMNGVFILVDIILLCCSQKLWHNFKQPNAVWPIDFRLGFIQWRIPVGTRRSWRYMGSPWGGDLSSSITSLLWMSAWEFSEFVIQSSFNQSCSILPDKFNYAIGWKKKNVRVFYPGVRLSPTQSISDFKLTDVTVMVSRSSDVIWSTEGWNEFHKFEADISFNKFKTNSFPDLSWPDFLAAVHLFRTKSAVTSLFPSTVTTTVPRSKIFARSAVVIGFRGVLREDHHKSLITSDRPVLPREIFYAHIGLVVTLEWESLLQQQKKCLYMRSTCDKSQRFFVETFRSLA